MIKTNYYPDYVFRPNATIVTSVLTKVRHGEKKGMARGRLVDNQIQKWIKHALCLEPSRQFKTKKLHLFARAFIELTKKLDWKPIGTQVVVRDERCNIATLVDSVFVNAKGQVVVVELKTGFDGYNDVSNGRMKDGFAYLTNAPSHQHQLQLAFTRCMFESTFPEFGQVQAMLIRMTNTGAHVRSLDPRIEKTARAIVRSGVI